MFVPDLALNKINKKSDAINKKIKLFSLLGIFSRNSNGFILEEKNIIVDIRRE
jgi:hypothetical protein